MQSGTPVKDADGNVYKTEKIGNQEWMAENLKTTKYNDGTRIPLVTKDSAWANDTADGYCWYNNDSAATMITYGALYNWYAVDTKKLAPIGWHIPTDSEWRVLINYLGGGKVAGDRLKDTCFSALPGGSRSIKGTFGHIARKGYWWSSSMKDSSNSWYRCLNYQSGNIFRYNYDMGCGFSVRCVKDSGRN